ncbi:Ser/Thr protein phosphatase family protein [Aphelenchoides avenae]|nr:Ser/Thr protein phosphatase family protein [Aphelenchus avenae]
MSNSRFNLEAFLAKHQKFKVRVEYTAQEVHALIQEAKVHYMNQKALIEVDIPVNVVGDIHGQWIDLQRIFAAVGAPGKQKYLFLGDYVDRGPQQMECICALLAYRLAFPTRIFLLRGNHECATVNATYGFLLELQERMMVGPGLDLYNEFNDLFMCLPLAAIIRGKILCMHGGISPRLNTLDDIKHIPLSFRDPPTNSLEQDLLWADPNPSSKGWRENDMRGVSVSFGEDKVYELCKRLGLDLIVRAHQVMKNGFGFFANRKLCTIFSAPRYQPEMNNRAAVMCITSALSIRFTLLNPVGPEDAGGENFHRTFKDDSSSYSFNKPEEKPKSKASAEKAEKAAE